MECRGCASDAAAYDGDAESGCRGIVAAVILSRYAEGYLSEVFVKTENDRPDDRRQKDGRLLG